MIVADFLPSPSSLQRWLTIVRDPWTILTIGVSVGIVLGAGVAAICLVESPQFRRVMAVPISGQEIEAQLGRKKCDLVHTWNIPLPTSWDLSDCAKDLFVEAMDGKSPSHCWPGQVSRAGLTMRYSALPLCVTGRAELVI